MVKEEEQMIREYVQSLGKKRNIKTSERGEEEKEDKGIKMDQQTGALLVICLA